MKVSEMMTSQVFTCGSDESLAEAAKKMQQHDIGCCPVVERGQLVGVITDRDMAVRAIAKGKDPNATMVGDVMSTSLVTGDPDMTIEDAAELMADNQIRRLPIVEGSRLIGMIALADLAIDLEEEEVLADTLTRISSPVHQ